MSSTGDLRARRLEDRLREARSRNFVGRAEELHVFRTALAGGPEAPAMLYVHGLGGIGKSALLRRFADEAHGAGRVVVEVDGRSGFAPAAFESAAAEALNCDDPLLLVDGFEHCQGLEGWLRQRFLPRLPDRALIVVAGRRPLSPDWRSDPGWAPLLRHLRLSAMSHREAAALLDARQVPAALREGVLSYAKGNPLALCLAGGHRQARRAVGRLVRGHHRTPAGVRRRGSVGLPPPRAGSVRARPHHHPGPAADGAAGPGRRGRGGAVRLVARAAVRRIGAARAVPPRRGA
ncbi:ATP-binding protein [Streptomyces sp. NPDC102274]|uniref:ATP-binding protein n=1 Tax=Streptomyces sp. NPDC102274 TaxID=3366151 RepID=UPI003826F5B7